MIVDDEPIILMALSHLLRNKETTVITCSTIEKAEEALSKYIFDLVVADIRLSGIDGIEGLELLSFIKEMHPSTEVIIMTAYDTNEIKEEAYKRGAFHYYEKPIDIKELRSRVQSLSNNMSTFT